MEIAVFPGRRYNLATAVEQTPVQLTGTACPARTKHAGVPAEVSFVNVSMFAPSVGSN